MLLSGETHGYYRDHAGKPLTRIARILGSGFDYQGERFRATLDFIEQYQWIDAPTRPFLIATGIAVPQAPDGARNVTQAWGWWKSLDQSVLLHTEYDAYVASALAAHDPHWGEFMRGDDATAGLAFPFVRRRGPLALIGLTSAVATAPFMATGWLGQAQIARLDALLPRLAGHFRVVMVHHPPGRSRRG